MKYKIGDRVKIRKDLVAGNPYGDNSYVEKMDKTAKEFNYVLTIKGYSIDETQYTMVENGWYYWTEEMIEGLAETTDREKFEECMRKLSSLESADKVWNAFNYCVTTEPDEDGYEDSLKIISDYLFAKKRK